LAKNAADGQACNVYFLQPNSHQSLLFKQQAKQNTESVGQLLIEFFHYYAYIFDFKNDVVSIRQSPSPAPPAPLNNTNGPFPPGPGGIPPGTGGLTTSGGHPINPNTKHLLKIDKSEQFGWPHHNRLSYVFLFSVPSSVLN
jgi:hypothetical protein